jgi:exodeoxyribonuclease VII large subunit
VARLPGPEDLLAARREKLGFLAHRLPQGLARRAQVARVALSRQAGRLSPRLLSARAERMRDRLDDRAGRLDPAFARLVRAGRDRLGALARLYGSLHYEETLKRGYVLVRGAEGTVLTRAAQVAPGSALELQFRDARIGATANGEAPPTRPAPRRAKAEDGGSQGSLF